jgi:replicative DNA helicase Mcm
VIEASGNLSLHQQAPALGGWTPKILQSADEDPTQMFESLFSREKYRRVLSSLSLSRKRSIEVDFMDIAALSANLAEKLINSPSEVLKCAEQAAFNKLSIEDPFYADELRAAGEHVAVRLINLPSATPIRMLKSSHVEKLVMVEGVVVSSTQIQPLIAEAILECRACGTRAIARLLEEGSYAPAVCPKCKKLTLEISKSELKLVDSQELKIQEKPEELPPGQTPRFIEVQAVGSDIVDAAKPGDHVRVIGVVRVRGGRDLKKPLKIILEANNIVTLSKEPEAVEITPEDESRILEAAGSPDAYDRLINSVAPSIYGRRHIKEAILLQLFGGVPKILPDINIRGDINILIVGDPGVAKSQLLKYAVKLSPRGLYTTGRGTTAAGLTAAIIQNERGGFTLEAGALVLADKGLCAIDEIEKMRNEDRVAMHEAMEQQTVSIAKGGVIATLNARTAILAAANPTLGRYDNNRPPIENIPLSPTLLSRFDMIFIIRDEPEEEADMEVSKHILSLHGKGSPEPPIPPDLLRKYIAYAKVKCKPKLSGEALAKIQEYYMKMRKASAEEGASVSITPRQLESLIRLTEARARALLKDAATIEDAEAAIRLMERALLDVGLDVKTGRIDVDQWATGRSKSQRDKIAALLTLIDELAGASKTREVSEETLKKAAIERLNISEGEFIKILSDLYRAGKILNVKAGYYMKA